MDEGKEDTLGILRAVRDLMSNPDHWTKGAYARDIDGRELADGNSDRACCWCLFGAVHKIRDYPEDPHFIVEALANTIGGRQERVSWGLVTGYNDNNDTTHAQVLALLDETIARLEAE